ncbi:MAG: sugar phosphate isomerase/epimerase [Verrucomicrobiales bacterium]|nr:sugar phosphate isomerase/epimerase [Verrucomicrobiales bacterium]
MNLLPYPDRRQFLGTCFAGGFGGLALGKGPLSGRIKIAVKYHMITDPTLSVIQKFELLREIGFDGVELKTNEKVDIAEVEKAIDKTGIAVHGIVNAGSPEIAPALELAHRLGSESVLVFAGEKKELSYDDNFAFWQDTIRAVLPLAEKHNLTICIENVRATFLKEAEEMARFIDSFESPTVKSYFDLGNTITWTEQSAQHWAQVLGKRIHKLDIKDRGHAVFGESSRRREGAIGTNGGEVHWEKVRELLVANDFSGWATAEVAGGDRAHLVAMAAWMRDVLDL